MALMVLGALRASADENADLRRYLSLLGEARIGDDYKAVKKLAPAIGSLHPDAGDNNMEAEIKVNVGKIALRGEFNFAKGHLVSHGFKTGDLTHADAHDFLLRCMEILEELYGPSERRIELPTETDGPGDSIGISFKWHKNETLFGLDFQYRRDFATINWGAQADEAKQ